MPFSCMLKSFISHKNMIAKINGSRPGSTTIPCRDEFKQNILKKGFDVINDFSANNWSHLGHCTKLTLDCGHVIPRNNLMYRCIDSPQSTMRKIHSSLPVSIYKTTYY